MADHWSLSAWRVSHIFQTQPHRRHFGQEIIRASGVAGGVVYPLLARFERRGWVTSEWEKVDETVVGRRRRRYYRVTAAGLAAFRAERERFSLLTTAVLP